MNIEINDQEVSTLIDLLTLELNSGMLSKTNQVIYNQLLDKLNNQ